MKYEVCVDWDATNWADEPDFSEDYDNISGDLAEDTANYIDWTRGKDREGGNAPAAVLNLKMRPGLCEKYSPWTTGILIGKVRPWLPIRVRAIIGSLDPIPVYFGFISKITIVPHRDIQSVSFYCTDGTDLLARQVVTQDNTTKTTGSDGAAVHKLLDAAGWPTSRRNIDETGGDDLVAYPNTTPF
jgi:hypothetical protein